MPAGLAGQAGDTASFSVMLRGARVGFEMVTVSRAGPGWRISSTGRQEAPFDLLTTRFEMTYGADWQPERLLMEGTLRGQPLSIATTFALTTATSTVVEAGARQTITQDVSPRAVVLPNHLYAAYEALAARLAGAVTGTRFPVYVAPRMEVVATVSRVTPKTVVTPGGEVAIRQYDLTVTNPAGSLGLEVSVDARGRLARVAIPVASLVVIRDDLASVTAREVTVRHPRDEDAYIPASGFSLASTITRPPGPGRAPAVILVSGVTPRDRDEMVAGVAVFGQLAGALADAGLFVVRFDRRGIGQSGGRVETAGLAEYAGDVLSIVAWLRRRGDVDRDRIAVVGYADGGPIALSAAARERRIGAVALVAAPGQTGREVTLLQQRLQLDRLDDPPADRQAKIALQQRIIDAVLTGRGWDDLPAAIRYQADTDWFRSWLRFDPATALARMEQPVLILHGALDREMPPSQAAHLAALARARRRAPPGRTELIEVAGVNHLLTPAATGEVDEYATLASRTVSPEVTGPLAAWLTRTLAAAGR